MKMFASNSVVCIMTLLHSEPCLSKGFRVVSFEPKTIAWDVWCNTNVHHI